MEFGTMKQELKKALLFLIKLLIWKYDKKDKRK